MNNLTFTPTYFFPHYDHLTATNNFHDSTRIYTLDSINSHLAAFNETLSGLPIPISPGYPEKPEFMSIENLKTYDPFAEADEENGEKAKATDYIHIRIQQRNGRKTLTTIQGIPSKFSRKKILQVVKKKFACNGTIVTDAEMGEVIQLQGDQRRAFQEFLTGDDGLQLDATTIKVHGF